jgi:hypothetical protein
MPDPRLVRVGVSLALDRCSAAAASNQVRRPPAEQLGQRWYEQQAPSRQPAASRPGTL